MVAASVAVGGALAQGLPVPDAIVAERPGEDATVGSRPLFAVRPSGVAETDLRRLRLRLTLASAGTEAPPLAFDRGSGPGDWYRGEEGELGFRPPRPLADGDYTWSVSAWDGVAWVATSEPRRLRVDTIPPAPIEDLRLGPGPTPGTVELRWSPVALDRDGAAEWVRGYRVYRSEGDPRFPAPRRLEIGRSESPRFLDESPHGAALLLWVVVAEDEAGNLAPVRPPQREND